MLKWLKWVKWFFVNEPPKEMDERLRSLAVVLHREQLHQAEMDLLRAEESKEYWIHNTAMLSSRVIRLKKDAPMNNVFPLDKESTRLK